MFRRSNSVFKEDDIAVHAVSEAFNGLECDALAGRIHLKVLGFRVR
jgi:hypothetical protein